MTHSRLLRNVILSVVLLGIALTYLLVGNQANERIYVVGLMLSLAFLFASISMWQGSRLIGYLTLAVIILSIVWQPMQPFSSALALILSVLGVTSGELRFRDVDLDDFTL